MLLKNPLLKSVLSRGRVPVLRNRTTLYYAPRSYKSDNEGGGYISDDDSKKFESDRRFSNFVLFAGSFALGVLLMASNVSHHRKEQEKKNKFNDPQKMASKTTYTGKADIGGPWMLYNTKGEPVTHKNFEGKYYLIYFGFTFCPDICPISLMKMTKCMNRVKASKEYSYFDLEGLFVSVDPDRDSNRRIEEYTRIFDESLIGLTHKTNDNEELKDMLKKFKIHVSKIFLTDEEEKEDLDALKEHAPQVLERMAKVEPKKHDKYTLDHSIIIYLFSPENEFLTYLGSNLDEKDMSDIVLDEIMADLQRKIEGSKIKS